MATRCRFATQGLGLENKTCNDSADIQSFPPVFDGLSAARESIYIPIVDGEPSIVTVIVKDGSATITARDDVADDGSKATGSFPSPSSRTHVPISRRRGDAFHSLTAADSPRY